MTKISVTKFFIYGIVLVIGVLTGIFIKPFSQIAQVGSCSSDLNLKFINPSLNCDTVDDKFRRIGTLQKKLEDQVSIYEKLHSANRVAVFVRDLDTNKFAGVNDSDVYYMASLLKLPLAIAGYKLAEVEPSLLDQKIKFNNDLDSYDLKSIKPVDRLVKGQEYSVRDLIKHTLVYSDNDSAQLLFDFYPKEFLDRILQALSIQIRNSDGEAENPITAKTYAGVFRMLFNASYLTREYSNEILDNLTKATYVDGALAKLPKDVSVAHKFAERVIVDKNSHQVILKQLHECGIVYAKSGNDPYIFCIMTEGDPDADLQSIVQNISLEIYNTIVN